MAMKAMKQFYVAYGSNLNKAQMKYRCPHAKPFCSGVIEDYELLFKGSKTGSYATIEPKKGSSVPVGVWEIDPRDEANLDRYEGFPTFYYKKYVVVRTKLGEVRGNSLSAMVYIMHEDHPIGRPSMRYVNTCLEGYDDFGLNKMEFYDALMTNAVQARNAAADALASGYDYGDDF